MGLKRPASRRQGRAEKEPEDRTGGQGPREMVAPGKLAAELSEARELLGSLHPLSRDLQAPDERASILRVSTGKRLRYESDE